MQSESHQSVLISLPEFSGSLIIKRTSLAKVALKKTDEMSLNLKSQENSTKKSKYLKLKKKPKEKGGKKKGRKEERKKAGVPVYKQHLISTNIFMKCTVAFRYLYFKGPNYLFMNPLRH